MIAWLLVTFAFAQAPAVFPASPGTVTTITEVAYTAAETPSVRFSDTATPGPTFTAGSRVDVLVRDGALVRIEQGDRFGWVPATALVASPPMPELPEGFTLTP